VGRRGRMKYQERKAIDHKSLEYNNGGGKTLADYVDSKFDPENYLGKGR